MKVSMLAIAVEATCMPMCCSAQMKHGPLIKADAVMPAGSSLVLQLVCTMLPTQLQSTLAYATAHVTSISCPGNGCQILVVARYLTCQNCLD